MKYSLALLPLLLSGAAFAHEQGAYLGVKAGVESITTELEQDSLDTTSLGQEGGGFGVYVGYQIPFVNGTAIAVEFERAGHDFNLEYGQDDALQSLELGASNSISTLLKNSYSKYVNVYLRLGVEQVESEFANGTGEVSEEKVRAALGGFGVEFMNRSNLSFRMEYRYTAYDAVDAFVLDDETTLAPELNAHAFSIGAHYRF